MAEKKRHVIFLILRIAAAIMLIQTVIFFKFPGHPDSVSLFAEVSRSVSGGAALEAPLRLGSGVTELITGILLLMPRAWAIASGAMLGMGTMVGAIGTHLGIIGIEHADDGGILFVMALVVFACCFALLFRFRGSLPVIGKFT